MLGEGAFWGAPEGRPARHRRWERGLGARSSPQLLHAVALAAAHLNMALRSSMIT